MSAWIVVAGLLSGCWVGWWMLLNIRREKLRADRERQQFDAIVPQLADLDAL